MQRPLDGAGGAAGASGRVFFGLWGVADQALISAANVVTPLLLARSLDPAAFGAFALAHSALLLANTLQFALITQPHNVLGAHRPWGDYRRYTGATAIGQLLLAGALALLALAGAGLAHVAGWEAAPLLLALAPAIAAWQLQEFTRRVLYTEGRLPAAFANGVVAYGGQAAGVGVLWLGGALTGPRAFLALAAAATLATALGGWRLRGSFARPLNATALRENWRYGKWLAGGELAGYWLSDQAHVYLAAALLGAPAAGVLKAIHLLFGPLRVPILALNTLLPIRFARTLADRGPAALRAQVRAVYLLAVPPLAGYCLLVGLGAEPLLRLAFGQRYLDHAAILALYAGYILISYPAVIVTAALRARRLTRPLLTVTLQASLPALAVAWPLIATLGLGGAVLGMLLTALVTHLLLWREWLGDRPAPPAPVPATTDALVLVPAVSERE